MMIELYILLFLFSFVIYTFVSIEHYMKRHGKDVINILVLYLSLIGIITCLFVLHNLLFFILVMTFVIIGCITTINTTRVL